MKGKPNKLSLKRSLGIVVSLIFINQLTVSQAVDLHSIQQLKTHSHSKSSTDTAQKQRSEAAEAAELDAMRSFSQAIADGVNVMDLPDAPAKKAEDEMSEEAATMVYSEQVNDQTQEAAAQQSQDRKKDNLEKQIAQIVQSFNDETQQVKKGVAEEPTEVMLDAQAAIDDVQIVLPKGMELRDHDSLSQKEQAKQADKEAAAQEALGQDSDKIIKGIQEQQDLEKTERELGINQESNDGMNDIQRQSQNALDYIQVQEVQGTTTGKRGSDEGVTEAQAEPAAPQEAQVQIEQEESAQEAEKQKKAAAQKAELTDAQKKAQAASEVIVVKQVVVKKAVKKSNGPEPIMPKTFANAKGTGKGPKSDIELSIEQAETSQNGKEESEEQVESQISGSENLWESSAEMHQITGKLTRPKNYKTPKQLRLEKKAKENAEKERIRQEILATVPVGAQDLKVFSGYLADKSELSKSEIEKQVESDQRQQEQLQKEQEHEEQIKEKEMEKEKEQKQQLAEEDAQIQAGNMARLQKKNNQDLQSVEDLRSLEKLQGHSNIQIDSMATQAEQEEQESQQKQIERESNMQLNSFVVGEINQDEKDKSTSAQDSSSSPNPENLAKVRELSQKLGVPKEDGDAFLSSKRDIAQVMVQRAIKAGKTQAQIKKALTS